jgi:hypothetical protein
MKYKHDKDITYNGASYNAKWIRRFNESEFVARAAATGQNLTDEQAKELHQLANTPLVQPVKNVELPKKKK